MHSRVFCMTTKLDAEAIEDALNLDENDVVDWIPGADYVVGRNKAEVQEDVDWLAEWLGIKRENEKDDNLIKPKVVSYDDEDYSCWPIPVEKLKRRLEKEVRRRVKNIRKLLKEPVPDLHSIAYEAYNQKGFFFWLDGTLMNEIDFYEFLNSKHNKDLTTLYVVGSFDYHF